MTAERPGVPRVSLHTPLCPICCSVFSFFPACAELIGYSRSLQHQQEMLSCQENEGERDEGCVPRGR